MAIECNKKDTNLESCSCTYEPCARKGICCECVRYHLRAGEIPRCFFPEREERSYDRSIANFVRARTGR